MIDITAGGLRLFVRPNAPDVAHGLLVGAVPRGAALNARTLLRFELAPPDPGALEVALVDPAAGDIRGQFTSDSIVRGCVAADGDRVLYVEGTSLVSRAIDGSDRREHVAGVLGENESLAGGLSYRDGFVVAVVRRANNAPVEAPTPDDDYDYGADNDEYDIRVFDVREGGAVKAVCVVERRGYVAVAMVANGALVFSEGGYDETDGVLEAVELTTGARRWQAVCASWFEGRTPYSFRFVTRDSALCVVCDGGTAVVDANTGAARSVIAGVQCVAIDDDDLALFTRGNRSLEARTLSDNTLVARWRTDARIERASAVDKGRFACVASRSIHVIDVREGEGAVEFGVEHSARDSLCPELASAAGWIALVPRGDRVWFSEQRPRERVTRLSSVEAQSCMLIDRPAELDPTSADAERIPPRIDDERLEAILAVHREERGDERAAWERLVAQSLVDASVDVERCLVTTNSAPFRLGDHRATGARAQTWLALAHDQPTIASGASVAGELCERLAPWCFGVAPRWRLETNLDWWVGVRSSLVQRLIETMHASVRFRATERVDLATELLYMPLDRLSVELDVLWRCAVERDLRLADTAPALVAGTRFAAVRSPFEPMVALCAMGFELRELTDEFVTSSLWGIDPETGRRIVPPPDDIPF